MKILETGSEWNKEDSELAEQLAHFVDNMRFIINQISGSLFEQYPLINSKNIDYLLLVKCNNLYLNTSSNRSIDKDLLRAALHELSNNKKHSDESLTINKIDVNVDNVKH